MTFSRSSRRLVFTWNRSGVDAAFFSTGSDPRLRFTTILIVRLSTSLRFCVMTEVPRSSHDWWTLLRTAEKCLKPVFRSRVLLIRSDVQSRSTRLSISLYQGNGWLARLIGLEDAKTTSRKLG